MKKINHIRVRIKKILFSPYRPESGDQLFGITLKSDSEKLVTKNLDGKGKKDIFYSHLNRIEDIHSKPVLSFYIAHGDMFRAQGDLLTPSELRDTLHQRRQVLFQQ